jgi:hypothetical protein
MVGLKEIVRQHLIETDEGQEAFARAYKLGINVYRMLMLDVAGSPKATKIEVLANKTAKLPDDYLSYTMLGVLNAQGAIATLSENNQLTLYKDCSSDRTTQEIQYGRDGDEIPFYYWANKPYSYPVDFTPSFGFGSNNTIGDFRISQDDGLILFPFHFRWSHIYLEYIGFPKCGEDDYGVHPFITETLNAGIYWYSIRKRKGIPANEKTLARAEYYNEMRKSELRFMNLNRQKINDLRVTTKLAIKG